MDQIRYNRGDTPILRNFSWTIRAGEHWALIGANGCGKTTALRIASGTEWPTSGSVSLLGQQFGHTDLRELRKKIGWVSIAATDRVVPDETAVDVVVSGMFASFSLYFERPPHEAWALARQHLSSLNCAALSDRKFGVLSQGERQKVMIARALMAEPRLLILDEPCSGLDLASRECLLSSIESLAQNPGGPTIIFVTHHIEEICPSISKVLAMKSGEIHTAGSKKTVLTDSVLSNIFGVALQVDSSGQRFWPRIQPPPPSIRDIPT